MTVDESEITRWWAEVHEELHEIADQLRSYLELACRELAYEAPPMGSRDFRYRSIDRPRVKSNKSVLRRLRDGSFDNLWQIDDLIGARVVVVTPSDAEALVARLKDDSKTGKSPLSDVKGGDSMIEESGYRGRHLKGVFSGRTIDVQCEIQIRTGLLDLWAVVSRYDLYLREDLPDALHLRAKDLAGKLADIDEELQAIRDESARVAKSDVEVTRKTD